MERNTKAKAQPQPRRSRNQKVVDYRCKPGTDVQYDIYTTEKKDNSRGTNKREVIQNVDEDEEEEAYSDDEIEVAQRQSSKFKKRTTQNKNSKKNKENINDDNVESSSKSKGVKDKFNNEKGTRKAETEVKPSNPKRRMSDEISTIEEDEPVVRGKRSKQSISLDNDPDTESTSKAPKINKTQAQAQILKEATNSRTDEVVAIALASTELSNIKLSSSSSQLPSPRAISISVPASASLHPSSLSSPSASASSSLFSSYEALLAEKDSAYDLLFQKFSLLSSQYKFVCSENRIQADKKTKEQSTARNELVEKLKHECAEYQSKISHLELITEKLTKEVNEHKLLNSNLESQAKESVSNQKALESALQVFESTQKGLQAENRELCKKVEDYETKLKKIEEKEMELKKQTTQTDKEMMILRSELKTANANLSKIARHARRNQRRSQFLLENYQLLTSTRMEIGKRKPSRTCDDKKTTSELQRISCKLVNRPMKRIFEFVLEIEDDFLNASDFEAEHSEEVEALIDNIVANGNGNALAELTESTKTTESNIIPQDNIIYNPINISLANTKYPKHFQTKMSFLPGQVPILMRDLLKICYQDSIENDIIPIKTELSNVSQPANDASSSSETVEASLSSNGSEL